MACNAPTEADRIARLYEFGILDTAKDDVFAALARQALALAPDMSISAITLVDVHRQWFKSIVGFEVIETPREVSFCSHTIQTATGVLVIEDATRDSRFVDNALVRSAPHIRSYAGVRLIDGVGALCLIGDRPRNFSDAEVMQLRVLAKYVDIQLLAHGAVQNVAASPRKSSTQENAVKFLTRAK